MCGSGSAAEVDHRAAALIGEDNLDRAVMAQALDHDTALTGTNNIGPADAHVTGLADGVVRIAGIAVAFEAVEAAALAFEPVTTAAAVAVADHDAAAGATDGKFETDAAGIGGRGGSCDAGSGDNEGCECGANEAVHDLIS
jgi:hypothetical protein